MLSSGSSSLSHWPLSRFTAAEGRGAVTRNRRPGRVDSTSRGGRSVGRGKRANPRRNLEHSLPGPLWAAARGSPTKRRRPTTSTERPRDDRNLCRRLPPPVCSTGRRGRRKPSPAEWGRPVGPADPGLAPPSAARPVTAAVASRPWKRDEAHARRRAHPPRGRGRGRLGSAPTGLSLAGADARPSAEARTTPAVERHCRRGMLFLGDRHGRHPRETRRRTEEHLRESERGPSAPFLLPRESESRAPTVVELGGAVGDEREERRGVPPSSGG